MHNVQRGDSGEYTITATNSSVRDSVTVTVTVTGKPSAPEGPLQVSDIHNEGCKLLCNQDDANSETTEVSDYSSSQQQQQLQQALSPASSVSLNLGLPPAPPRSVTSAGSDLNSPSPNHVRRSKRHPMTDLSSLGGSSLNNTASPLSSPMSSVGIAHRGVVDYHQHVASSELPPPSAITSSNSNPPMNLQQFASVGNSPTHVYRSLRMGRKSLRPYQAPPPQQQPDPPLYENHPPLETLSQDDSPRYRSEPLMYSGLPGSPEQQQVEPKSTEMPRQVTINLSATHDVPR
jgi:hypothetical protein